MCSSAFSGLCLLGEVSNIHVLFHIYALLLWLLLCGKVSGGRSEPAREGRSEGWGILQFCNCFCLYLVDKFRRRQRHPTPVLLPGKSHGWRSLVGCSPWGHEELTRLSDFTFTFHFHTLEKEMATHSSVLAWRIPGTVEPAGLPSMRSHRVGHDWSDLAAAAAVDKLNFFLNNLSPCVRLTVLFTDSPFLKLCSIPG